MSPAESSAKRLSLPFGFAASTSAEAKKASARASAHIIEELDGNVVSVIDHIIEEAIMTSASDIHIEPGREETAVRLRVDGGLRTVFTIPASLHSASVGRLKVMAGLKSDEHRRPQDGRIEPRGHADTSLRISTLPTLFGEKVTLRLMQEGNRDLSIQALGFSSAHRATIARNIEKPFGMIIASGPTGSGKTTTLYALLNLLRGDESNISTLEDPIEYALPGVNQVQINPMVDLKFATGLRALLRQDPDVIMVGEVRDSETAAMAGNAAMTGHLVLTTLHTNDAPSAITRLLEMKVEDFVVGSVLNLIIAQRLVRRVCSRCVRETRLSDIVLKKIAERKDVLKAIQAHDRGGTAKKLAQSVFQRGAGCEACGQTGYAGRLGIYELLEPTRDIHDLILAHATAERIRAAAEKNGFHDMVTDGVAKVFRGETTFEEVLRVTRNS